MDKENLDSATSKAVCRNIFTARKQRGEANGMLVMDGRDAGLTRGTAERGMARAVGQARAHGQELPSEIHIIIADGTSIVVRQED